MDYWDTSALVKLYVREADSAQFTSHLMSREGATTSELARWEFFRVLARKEADGLLSAGGAAIIFSKFLADTTIGNVRLLPIDQNVESSFRQLILTLHGVTPPILARTLDGIHLATANLHGAAELVTTDANMRKFAAVMNIRLFP